MARAIFLNRFYWPETPATGQLLTDLATGIRSRGMPVLVITSGTAGGAPRREVHSGVEIVRVRSPRWAHGTIAGKGIAYLGFLLGATIQLLRHARRGDTIVAMTDPPLLGIIAWMVAGLRGARLVHWVQDVYPEVAIAVTGHRWLGALTPLRNAAWRGADRCIALSQTMAELIRDADVIPARIAVVPNWAPAGVAAIAPTDPAVAQLRKSWGLQGKIIVAYSGNLGRVHDLAPIIDAATLLAGDARIAFVFIGGGAQRGALETQVAKRNLRNVHFLPTQPRKILPLTLAVGDIHLVTLRRGCEAVVFPSKLYGIAAAERPIVFVGSPDCELAELIQCHGLGRAANSRQPTEVAQVIRDLADAPARRLDYAKAGGRFAADHTAERAIAEWYALLSPTGAC